MIAARRATPAQVTSQRESWLAGLPGSGPVTALPGLITAAGVIAADASLRSVWFRNSARGAVALAAAVAVAKVSDVQHAFWVVLGTLSVLRTSATATGQTALRGAGRHDRGLRRRCRPARRHRHQPHGAVDRVPAGRAGRRVYAGDRAVRGRPGSVHGDDRRALQPAGAGRLASRAAASRGRRDRLRGEPRRRASCSGRAASPPSSATTSLTHSAAAPATSATPSSWALGDREQRPEHAAAAFAAGSRLDDALRGYLTEQGSKRLSKSDLWALVMAALRLRLTAHSMASPPSRTDPHDDDGGLHAALGRQVAELASFYDSLAGSSRQAQPGGADAATRPAAAKPHPLGGTNAVRACQPRSGRTPCGSVTILITWRRTRPTSPSQPSGSPACAAGRGGASPCHRRRSRRRQRRQRAVRCPRCRRPAGGVAAVAACGTIVSSSGRRSGTGLPTIR